MNPVFQLKFHALKCVIFLLFLFSIQLTSAQDINTLFEKYHETQDTLYLNQALKTARSRQDTISIAEATRLLAKSLGVNSAAVPSFLEALRLFRISGDSSGMIKANVNVGILYFDLFESNLAGKHLEEALHIASKMKDSMTLSIILTNLGAVYDKDSMKMDKALEYYQQAFEISKQLGDTIGLMSLSNNLGFVYMKMNQATKAIEYYKQALIFARHLDNDEEACRVQSNMGSIMINLKRFNEALKILNDSEVDCHDISTNLASYRIRLYSEVEAGRGNYERAYQLATRFKAIDDSIYSIEQTKSINELATRYETEKQLHQIQILEKDKLLQQEEISRQAVIRNGLLLLAVLFGGFAIVFFLQRIKISKEQKKNEELLLNILPADIAEELKTQGYSEARQYDQVTVIFSDFVGFTQHGEAMTPQALVKELDICFKAFDAIMEKYQIEKIKTIGDAYLAVCGLPKIRTGHAEVSCLAAKEMLEFINSRKRTAGVFDVRIGIHSGPVVAGIVGVKKYAYDIWGDTVNIAARMEQNSLPGKINISQHTYDLISDEFLCEPRGLISVKNKGDMHMYFLNAKA